jgi:hypothetical protein
MLARLVVATTLVAATPVLSREVNQTGSISYQPQVRGMGCLRSETRAMVRQLVSRIGPIQITSTCGGRHVRNSQHYRGKAIDFRPRATSVRGAVGALKRMQGVGGVGAYAIGIVHADVGSSVHSWYGRGSSGRFARSSHRRYAHLTRSWTGGYYRPRRYRVSYFRG